MSFRHVQDKLSDSEQKKLRRRLTVIAGVSATGRQVEQNLWSEARLPTSSAADIVKALLNAKGDAGSLKDAYVTACRNHIVKGPKIKEPRPELLGRAVTAKSFYEMLVRQKKFPTMASARAAIGRRLGLSGAETARRMETTPLGQYLMWATYCRTSPDASPFDALPVGANDIRDLLGLDPADDLEPLLLFVYEPPPDLALRFPTVADAQWHYAFRPAPDDPKVESGRTLPRKEDLKPQPEVVHEPVLGNVRRRPIEERLP